MEDDTKALRSFLYQWGRGTLTTRLVKEVLSVFSRENGSSQFLFHYLSLPKESPKDLGSTKDSDPVTLT